MFSINSDSSASSWKNNNKVSEVKNSNNDWNYKLILAVLIEIIFIYHIFIHACNKQKKKNTTWQDPSKESSNKSSTPLNHKARCHPRRGGTFAPPKRYTLLVAAEQLTCCCCNAVVGWTILSESLAKNQQLGDGRKYHRWETLWKLWMLFVCCISSWSKNHVKRW